MYPASVGSAARNKQVVHKRGIGTVIKLFARSEVVDALKRTGGVERRNDHSVAGTHDDENALIGVFCTNGLAAFDKYGTVHDACL